ncbi:S-acyltransferase 11 [Olea europaea subsp. europaea]|uniref:S-acyltransferase n=1 Tax=Olea europaea subsp. europaea TaxID=158383 RepID=A0A8S0PE65_OLEEU|nr:S-acyltransferase 11 [Olea europaea subsp. europaea]
MLAMDCETTNGLSSNENGIVSKEEDCSTSVDVDHETTCWGCGLRVLVSPYASVFKCGWCGGITKQNALKCENQYFKWRRLRDWCFVSIVLLFMLCFISFRPAGSPPTILWGSYPTVGKSGLENFTFCHYCSKPKSPRTHHCRSCGICILDMDHHCPFIGNCVGAANHRSFILFLLSAVISMIYVIIMSSYSALHISPPLNHRPVSLLNSFAGSELIFNALKETILTFLRSEVFLSARGLALVYLFITSVSVEIGLSVLLWQQLYYIYEGKTYLSHLRVTDSEESSEKDCQNLVRFFGCPYVAAIYLPSFWKSGKSHKK